jgi:hypothetical protein
MRTWLLELEVARLFLRLFWKGCHGRDALSETQIGALRLVSSAVYSWRSLTSEYYLGELLYPANKIAAILASCLPGLGELALCTTPLGG